LINSKRCCISTTTCSKLSSVNWNYTYETFECYKNLTILAIPVLSSAYSHDTQLSWTIFALSYLYISQRRSQCLVRIFPNN